MMPIMRIAALVLVTAATLSLSGCGSATPSEPGESGVGTFHTAPDDELVGRGMLMQDSADSPVELCLGAVAASYPPQCSGPTLKGDFSWDQVVPETSNGVTWTERSYWVVGRYDPDDGEQGSFTLAVPPSAEPPEGWTPPEESDVTFPQLCEDPTVDVPQVDQADRTNSPTGMDEEQALMGLFQSMDGYVTSWVSDGGPTFNVIVNTDPDAVRARIREVFTGPLCIEQRDLPAEADVRAAQEAMLARDDLHLTDMSSGGVSGLLEIGVVVADAATVEAIHETVADWLTPEQVVVRGEFQPLRHP